MINLYATPYLWSEFRQAASAEGVVHLNDLLLLAPKGGIDLLPRMRAMVQPELGWDDERWEEEVRSYSHLWKKFESSLERRFFDANRLEHIGDFAQLGLHPGTGHQGHTMTICDNRSHINGIDPVS